MNVQICFIIVFDILVFVGFFTLLAINGFHRKKITVNFFCSPGLNSVLLLISAALWYELSQFFLWFLVLLVSFQVLQDCSKCSNYDWSHCHLHVLSFFSALNQGSCFWFSLFFYLVSIIIIIIIIIIISSSSQFSSIIPYFW